MKPHRLWLVFAIITTFAWGVWGSFAGAPANAETPGEPIFPETLGYIVWSLTMIPPAIVALWLIDWKLETNIQSIALGMAIGVLGAAGQLVLFKALRMAPPHLLFPFIALSPLVTISLAAVILRERVRSRGTVGIILAIVAGVLLSLSASDSEENELNSSQNTMATSDVGVERFLELSATADATTQPQGILWAVLALVVLLTWGIQGFMFSYANTSMKAESIFFYMMVSAIALAPFAWFMTDFSQPIDWKLTSGPGLSASIHILNSVGALLIVYAFRYGKAMLVAPLTNAGAPVITIVLSLMLSRVIPVWYHALGMALAIVATILMAVEGETERDV